jgi:hypothetical protein
VPGQAKALGLKLGDTIPIFTTPDQIGHLADVIHDATVIGSGTDMFESRFKELWRRAENNPKAWDVTLDAWGNFEYGVSLVYAHVSLIVGQRGAEYNRASGLEALFGSNDPINVQDINSGFYAARSSATYSAAPLTF